MVNEKNKVIFGWSAKCGCSHIKNLFYFFIDDNIDNKIHTNRDVCNLPINLTDYTVILFIRNPYKRIVSGFLDKYQKNGEFRNRWKNKNIPITFNNFVNELCSINNNFTIVDKHHFTQQLSEHFNKNILFHKNKIIYDIEKIDYSNLEKLFNKKIPEEVLNFKGNHIYSGGVDVNYSVYDFPIDTIIEKQLKPQINFFFNKEIKNKIDNFYKIDFVFFRTNGFDYKLEL